MVYIEEFFLFYLDFILDLKKNISKKQLENFSIINSILLEIKKLRYFEALIFKKIF